MFVILQKYDFSSKSQLLTRRLLTDPWCLWYCKSTIFQANHNVAKFFWYVPPMFVILQKYDFSSKSQPSNVKYSLGAWCLWYCKSTIFQANHNKVMDTLRMKLDVCDTAKVRFFKQITTAEQQLVYVVAMFVILQKYDFSSKSQPCLCQSSAMKRCLWYCKSTIFQANHNRMSCGA